jgi:hypothetical protein
MKDEGILIRLSKEELQTINAAYKRELIEHELVSRSEFLRRLIFAGLGKK